MLRVPEPELMDDVTQASAYAEADFGETDAAFIERFTNLVDRSTPIEIADLGCGPGNIALRLVATLPHAHVTALDGADAMLSIGRRRADAARLVARVNFIKAILPTALPDGMQFDAVVSNSLLHHLHDPLVLWQTVVQIARPGAWLLVRDLRRPASITAAREIVERYASDAPEILRVDFLNSLCASFEVEEIQQQLVAAGLKGLRVIPIGDRHLEIVGRLPT